MATSGPRHGRQPVQMLALLTATALMTARTAACAVSAAVGQPPAAAVGCWRPTVDDVDRISWGRPAKQKGTGSRGVPHRLNADERELYDRARRKGFVEIDGSGWRRQRSDAPLVNTFRSWSDALGQPAIYVHKAREGIDEVVVDLSPLRTPLGGFDAAAEACLLGAPDGVVEFDAPQEETAEAPAAEERGDARLQLTELADAYRDEPIYRVPMYAVVWSRPRAEAKALAKQLAQSLGTAAVEASPSAAGRGGRGAAAKGRAKERGAPRVKPGKSRKSGGYGIG